MFDFSKLFLFFYLIINVLKWVGVDLIPKRDQSLETKVLKYIKVILGDCLIFISFKGLIAVKGY